MRLFLHFATFSVLGLAGVNPHLGSVQSVYIFPMSGGMDQFLANRITRLGKMQIVADPQIADTILTDRIGEPFEKRLDLIYGSNKKKEEKKEAEEDDDMDIKTTTEKVADPMPVKTADVKTAPKDANTKEAKDAADAKEKADSDAQDKAAKQKSDAAKAKAAKEKADAQAEQVMRVTSFGRGKGTYFLVDRKTRSVIWSVYEPPKNTSSHELNKTAEKVVKDLKRDLMPPVTVQN